jgi:tetratricopeptide (TPR) repeat protein
MDQRGPAPVGQLISGYRRDAALTQRQLADVAGVSIGVVRDLEQGRTAHLQPASASRLASALRLDRHQAAELFRRPRGRAGSAGPGPGGLAIRVLGPLCAWRGGVPVQLGGPMLRTLLGLLALHADITLPRSSIIDALWGDRPPATAVAMIQSYVSRLRSLLDPGRAAREPGRLLITVSAGYRLRATDCDLDHATFTALAGRARDAHAAGDLTEACAAYERALGLWLGAPLADIDVLRGHPAVIRLSQQRADVVIGYADAAVAAGWPDLALPEVRGLASEEPLNERVHARLMIVLAGSGQQAAALTVYDQLRGRLDDQLGVLPGAELADAYARVLRQDIPGATGPGAGHGGGGPRAAPAQPPGDGAGPLTVPRQLPAGVPHFVGRAAELDALTGLLDESASAATTVLISAIGGTAGVGKTALAVRWGQQVAERFPDGQLYVNLRGYDLDQPVLPADALAGFLRALGVPGQDIPVRTDERAALYRSLLAGRRMLVLLDNAHQAEQVRPLLPGSPPSVAVVTSRESLSGLVARDGARRLDLDSLSAADAVTLLRALIGGRVAAEPAAATALADHCARLPLALRLAAEFAAGRPATQLAELAGELGDEQRRLDVLNAGGDPRTGVRAVFSWSYRDLDADAARAFRLHGLAPCLDISPHAVAALTGATLEHARRMLDRLTRAHLTEPVAPDRYGLHDLLNAYARQLSVSEDSAADRRAALTRLFDHYVHTAATAMDALFPAEDLSRPRVPGPASSPNPIVTGVASARAWLDAERASLVAVAAHAAEHGWPGHAASLAAILSRYLDRACYYREAITIHTCARRAAQRTGDLAAEAVALFSLGTVDARQGRYQQASSQLQQALALCRETGDLASTARARHNLGMVDFQQGHYQQASSHFQQALALFREIGDRPAEGRAVSDLGLVHLRQGRYQQASGHFQEALRVSRETGDTTSEAYALGNIGDIDLRLGRYQQAIGHLQRALAVFREGGHRGGEGYTLTTLGDAWLRRGDHQQASSHNRAALALFRELGDRPGEAEALNGLGEILLATGHPEQARAQHIAALDIADQIGHQDQRARAHSGLARSWHATGDGDRAGYHMREAAALYGGLGVPEPGQLPGAAGAPERAANPEAGSASGDRQETVSGT